MSHSELTWAHVHARRTARHALTAPLPAGRAAEAARALCGAHAQVLSAAELSIGLRVADTTRSDVRAALWDRHELVKTFGPRGTVHLLATADLPVWTAALSAIPSSASPFPDGVRFTAAEVDAVVAAIDDALIDATLTTDELGDEVVARTGPWAGERTMEAFQDKWPRWRQAISAAAHRGVLCFGPTRGRKVTYASPRRYLPSERPGSEEALAQLVRWYLTSYGPATPHQFAQWLSAPRGWATTLFATLADELEPVDVEGFTGWVVAGEAAPTDDPPGGLRLLPYFDAYQVGSHPRDRVFPGPARERALAGSQAGNYPVLLIDGVVAGVWHLRRSGRRLAITVEPLRPLSARRRAELDVEVERVGVILEGTPTLTIGPITVGAHA
ncbi:winged helix DNA-binding domain-containing protein [Cryptosporangium aurantiacum]|uniref:Winged helix DNA-binding domain-containing protein n=1 Tax=Cryptosporangium aurantiacum TaxID=134849 RepID=A0A1M7TTZ5_9ACTN|nr:winged helix DNA-binding domain-containing protein [Cryptosporangium aurantiacum]SHN74191.1 Winged helix DNA-binding domain-containing protein [Cryptosporangium aurantiacum]